MKYKKYKSSSLDHVYHVVSILISKFIQIKKNQADQFLHTNTLHNLQLQILSVLFLISFNKQ